MRWLTSNKWIGGYEASCPMREGLELHIVGKDGSPLFRESIVKAPGYSDTVAEKIAPFSWEAIGAMAGEQAMKLRLRDYYGWKEWLLKSADEVGFTGEKRHLALRQGGTGPRREGRQVELLGENRVARLSDREAHRLWETVDQLRDSVGRPDGGGGHVRFRLLKSTKLNIFNKFR